MGSKSGALIRQEWRPHKKTRSKAFSLPPRFPAQAHRGNAVRGPSKETATRKAGREPSPGGTLPAPWPGTSRLQNRENTHLCRLNHPN